MKHWTTKEGNKILISEMETSHIENCINMLDKQVEELLELNEDYIDASGDTDMTWNLGVYNVRSNIERKTNKVIILKEELKRRGEVDGRDKY